MNVQWRSYYIRKIAFAYTFEPKIWNDPMSVLMISTKLEQKISIKIS